MPTRQQIYDTIKETSKDSYILSEMKRLGFWEDSPQPTLSELIIQKEAALQKELNELLEKQRKYNNREAMLKAMREEKLKLSKEKQAATKLRNEQKHDEKAQKWRETQTENLVYLGEEVSAGLGITKSNVDILHKNNLPNFVDIVALSKSMDISLAHLRFLAFHRKVSKVCHYNSFSIPKKSGGKRLISAPKKKLKAAQTWLLENVLYKVENHDAVHGFVPNHSIKTNAEPHLNKEVVINLDLKDFFPYITYERVKGLFVKLGYSEQIATVFALLCTQAEVDKVNVDGQIFYAQKGKRFLPQGSPASPAITTLIAYKMDLRLQGLATKFGFTYTRYADDLTFSATVADDKNINMLLTFVKKVVESEDFILHPDKTHVMRNGSQKKVTGIVVNEKLNVDRDTLRKFRALLNQVEKTGWNDKYWGNSPNIVNSVIGFANFVSMVNIEKGKQFKTKIAELLLKYPAKDVVMNTQSLTTTSITPIKIIQENINQAPKETDNTNNSDNDWWNVFEK